MPTLSVTKSYADGDVLFEADLDNIKSDLETFVNTTKLDDDNIQDNGITASTKIIDATITEGKIAASAITTNKIASGAVTTAKIADGAVTTTKIADLNVTAAKIADSNVTTAKIANGAVTNVKRASLNYAISSSCGNFAFTASSYVDITNLSVSLTTIGRPVFFALVPDGASAAYLNTTNNTGGAPIFRLYNSTSAATVQEFIVGYTSSTTPSASFACPVHGVFTLAAGTYAFKMQARVALGSSNHTINYYKLLMYEI